MVVCRAVNARLAILASGSGTNLQALLDDPVVGPTVALVVTDREGAGALDRAASAGVKGVHLDPAPFEAREEYDAALLDLLRGEEIDLVCLAGFMRILSPVLVEPFQGRMLNIHPSLLPAFPGASAPSDALAWGAKVTGVTVHFVDEEVDHGPIVLQEPVRIEEGDDAERLHERIKGVEHRVYPEAVRLWLGGRLRLEGRVVRVEPETP